MATLLREYVRLIVETSLESSARKAGRVAFEYIKNHKGRQRRYKFDIDDFPIDMVIKKSRSAAHDASITGLTEEDKIRIFVKLGQGFLPERFPITHQKLINVLRHELEHFRQYQRAKAKKEKLEPTYDVETALSGDPDAMRSFLLDPSEIEAFVSDIYMNAKKQRRPFEDAFKDRIRTFGKKMFRAGATKQEVRQIVFDVRKAWFDYARRRFPAVNLPPR